MRRHSDAALVCRVCAQVMSWGGVASVGAATGSVGARSAQIWAPWAFVSSSFFLISFGLVVLLAPAFPMLSVLVAL